MRLKVRRRAPADRLDRREWSKTNCAGNEVGTFLAPSDLKRRRKAYHWGVHMITMAIGLVAGLFYWMAWYKLAFWILLYAMSMADSALCAATTRRTRCCGAIPL